MEFQLFSNNVTLSSDYSDGLETSCFPFSLFLCVLEEKTYVGVVLGEPLKAPGPSARRIYAGVTGP